MLKVQEDRYTVFIISNRNIIQIQRNLFLFIIVKVLFQLKYVLVKPFYNKNFDFQPIIKLLVKYVKLVNEDLIYNKNVL